MNQQYRIATLTSRSGTAFLRRRAPSGSLRIDLRIDEAALRTWPVPGDRAPGLTSGRRGSHGAPRHGKDLGQLSDLIGHSAEQRGYEPLPATQDYVRWEAQPHESRRRWGNSTTVTAHWCSPPGLALRRRNRPSAFAVASQLVCSGRRDNDCKLSSR